MTAAPANATAEVAVVGSLNLDLTARVRRHPLPGQTVPASTLTPNPGGKGANQAVAAARLGARTALIGRVGTDPHADTLLYSLRSNGVDTTRITHDGNAVTGTALVTVADSGENTITVAAGANAHLNADHVDAARSVLESAGVVSLVMEIPLDTVVAAAHAAADSARIMLNLSPVADIPTDVLALADPLIVNEHEAHEILRNHHLTAEPGVDQASALCRLGVRSAVVTLGARGAALADADLVEHVPGLPVDVVDTTGAGDAFAATLAWRLSQGDALPAAVGWAIRVSAHSVGRTGAQTSYPTLNELTEPAGRGSAPHVHRSEASQV
ncbi:ribokinase [Haloechinothrix halophila]|uniref:ribokinase n=1 Tax=Haloechinothrix halophila TaxID=1069073 RepID=UPI00041A7E2A|nr:ribokinase [Haloechinothrix halophila]